MAGRQEAQRAQPVVLARADQAVAEVEHAGQAARRPGAVQQVHRRVFAGQDHRRPCRKLACHEILDLRQQMRGQAGALLPVQATRALPGDEGAPFRREGRHAGHRQGMHLGGQPPKHGQQFALLRLRQLGPNRGQRLSGQLGHHGVGPAIALAVGHQARRGHAQLAVQAAERRTFELEVVAQEGWIQLDHQVRADQGHQHRALLHRPHGRRAVPPGYRGDQILPTRDVVVQRVEGLDANGVRKLHAGTQGWSQDTDCCAP